MTDNEILLKKPLWRNQLNVRLVASILHEALHNKFCPSSHMSSYATSYLGFLPIPLLLVLCHAQGQKGNLKLQWTCEVTAFLSSPVVIGRRFDGGSRKKNPLTYIFWGVSQIFGPANFHARSLQTNRISVFSWICAIATLHITTFFSPMLQAPCAKSWKPVKAHQSSRPTRFQWHAGSTFGRNKLKDGLKLQTPEEKKHFFQRNKIHGQVSYAIFQ